MPTENVANETDFITHLILNSLNDDKAEDISVIDLHGKTSFADTMIVASGRSQRHVSSLADHIVQKLKEVGHAHLNIEGQEQANWVLIDAGDVIIHLFRPETRQMYNLEKMWAVAMPMPELVM